MAAIGFNFPLFAINGLLPLSIDFCGDDDNNEIFWDLSEKSCLNRSLN